MTSYVPAKEFEGELWVRAADFQKAISEAEGAAWQGLTDDEIESCNNTTTDWGEPCVWLWDDDFEEGGLQFARAIEAKLKEKNT